LTKLPHKDHWHPKQFKNSRQNDINLKTATDFFAARCAKGKFCDGFLNQQKQGLRGCKSQLQNERPSPPYLQGVLVGVISMSVAANARD
jgi:uncharacterized protein (DUF983 family)